MYPSEDWDGHTSSLAEQALGYVFQNKSLLKQCFTHKSFADNSHQPHNERLEFLGDAVLQFAVSESLYLKEDTDEGRMTEMRKRYVSREALNKATAKAGILKFLRYAGGEDTIGGKTPSNLFEAVVAGIYLDGGMNAARAFLKRYLEEDEFCNYKSLLQEYVQERTKNKPEYSTRQTDGGYGCTVRALGKEAAGFGKSKKLAEVSAAEQLLKLFKERKE